MRITATILIPILTAIIGGVISTFVGDWMVSWFQDLKSRNVREVAVMDLSYVECITIHYPWEWLNAFSNGERRVLLVFYDHMNDRTFYDEQGHIRLSVIESMFIDVERGLYDTYNYWDYESYVNIEMQKPAALEALNAIARTVQLVKILPRQRR